MKKTDLRYKEFEKYEVKTDDYDCFKEYGESFCHRFRFQNRYGASVIKHHGSYGYEDNLFELAVLKFNDDDDFDLCYDTEITGDVIGFLGNDDVLELLKKIKKLNEVK